MDQKLPINHEHQDHMDLESFQTFGNTQLEKLYKEFVALQQQSKPQDTTNKESNLITDTRTAVLFDVLSTWLRQSRVSRAQIGLD